MALVARSLHILEVARLPALVQGGFRRAIEPQDGEDLTTTIYSASDVLQDKAPPADKATQAPPCEQPAPALPDFGGPLWCRSYFTGDWCGIRPCLAESGVMFEGNVTQYFQGVSSGGTNTNFQYGGHADYLLNIDMDKAAGLKGLFLKLRGETQFGQFVNRDTGALIPALGLKGPDTAVVLGLRGKIDF